MLQVLCSFLYDFIPPVGGNCTFGDMRLVGGDDKYEGRVEICVSGEWGSVCDEGWSFTDARVACRQLGYSDTGQPVIYTVREIC